ncbi:hypothetical protein R1flu_006097 [Riccia fluitans]|uniref:Uncharacterized protein n=1 Tax=Riccia fluitans TaxID=41844 RepID=A0ABD1YVA3_9MARC
MGLRFFCIGLESLERRSEFNPELPGRPPWLRALVLEDNDELVSISSVMLGVEAVTIDIKAMVISGLAGLVAGAGSMAIREFISVIPKRDSDN